MVTRERTRAGGTMWPLLPLLLHIVPGASYDLTGPREVRGLEWGSLTVQCHYKPGWERYVKWWCRGADWSSCEILAKTTGFRQKVGRVSIRDDMRYRMFTVTMRELMKKDADVYWCGIERAGTDLVVPVRVIIDSATVSSTSITITTTPTTTSTSTTTLTMPFFTEDITSSLTVTSPHSSDRSLLRSVHFQLLVFLKLPLLLSMLSAVLWVHRPHRDSGKAESA